MSHGTKGSDDDDARALYWAKYSGQGYAIKGCYRIKCILYTLEGEIIKLELTLLLQLSGSSKSIHKH